MRYLILFLLMILPLAYADLANTDYAVNDIVGIKLTCRQACLNRDEIFTGDINFSGNVQIDNLTIRNVSSYSVNGSVSAEEFCFNNDGCIPGFADVCGYCSFGAGINVLNDTKTDAFACPGQVVQNASAHSVQCIDLPEVVYYDQIDALNSSKADTANCSGQVIQNISAHGVSCVDFISVDTNATTQCSGNTVPTGTGACADMYCEYNLSETNYCYQESANVSTACGGSSLGFYTMPNQYVYPFSITYKKPLNSALGTIWQVKHGRGDAYNITIPSDCWNANATHLILRMEGLSVLNGSSYSNVSCWNGAVYETIGNFYNESLNDTYKTNDGIQVMVAGQLYGRLFDGDWNNYVTYRDSGGFWARAQKVSVDYAINGTISEEGMFWNIPTTTRCYLINYTWNSTTADGLYYPLNTNPKDYQNISYFSDEIYINQINYNFTYNESKHNDSIDAKIASKDLINNSYANSTYCFANGTNISGQDCIDLTGYVQNDSDVNFSNLISVNLTVPTFSNLSGFIICTNASGVPKLADALGYARARADGRC